eukprot:m.308595 g.308595  ORF g.308595 m.308595 type:complete len:136 (+) comp55330_c0_seq5:605-1012(+)
MHRPPGGCAHTGAAHTTHNNTRAQTRQQRQQNIPDQNRTASWHYEMQHTDAHEDPEGAGGGAGAGCNGNIARQWTSAAMATKASCTPRAVSALASMNRPPMLSANSAPLALGTVGAVSAWSILCAMTANTQLLAI